MNRSHLLGERLVALFLLAVLLLNPPLLTIFDRAEAIAQIPVLYVYLFTVWALLISLLALIIEFTPLPPDDEQATPEANPSPPTDVSEGA